MIKVEIDESLSELLISDMKSNDVPALKRDLNDGYAALEKYSDCLTANQDLCNLATITFEKAESWMSKISETYRKLEVHTLKASKDISIELKTFSQDGDQTIYEFLSDFEKKYKGRGTVEQRADVMWSQHFSLKIKNEMDHIKTDLPAMKRKLIANYGDLSTCLECITKKLEKVSPPSPEDL